MTLMKKKKSKERITGGRRRGKARYDKKKGQTGKKGK